MRSTNQRQELQYDIHACVELAGDFCVCAEPLILPWLQRHLDGVGGNAGGRLADEASLCRYGLPWSTSSVPAVMKRCLGGLVRSSDVQTH
jgi:hypothetical protein